MDIEIYLPDGEPVEIDSLAGEILTIRSPRAFPPGAPLALELNANAERFPIAAKTIGSRRNDDGTFELRVRLVSLRRDYRMLIERFLTG